MKLRRYLGIFCIVVGAIAIPYFFAFGQTPNPANTPQFIPPIACTLGKDCYILRYFDHDPGPGEVDFACGRLTGDKHDGTDFGIPDDQTMTQGVPVVAIAPGQVLRARDGVVDRRIRNPAEVAKLQGMNCGNGIVIDHGNGWEAQYCHLRQGSIQVKPGTQVQAGTPLGMVGASGEASFPHVHLTLRYQGKAVDPFVGVNAQPGCQNPRQPLWAKPLEYVPGGLIRAGFSPRPPEMEEIWQGQFREDTLPISSEALVFWVQAFGVLPGDVETLRLIDPQGQPRVDQKRTLERASRLWLPYGGISKRLLRAGTWRGEYQLVRNGKTLVNLTRELTVRS